MKGENKLNESNERVGKLKEKIDKEGEKIGEWIILMMVWNSGGGCKKLKNPGKVLEYEKSLSLMYHLRLRNPIILCFYVFS